MYRKIKGQLSSVRRGERRKKEGGTIIRRGIDKGGEGDV
jgi:hypothetical protein